MNSDSPSKEEERMRKVWTSYTIMIVFCVTLEDIQAYTGQAVEVYSSDDENDEVSD